MTDKTSTAPVMSLQDIRDLLAGAQPGVVPSRVSLHVTRVRKAIDSLDAHLSAPTPDVVGGDVVDEDSERATFEADISRGIYCKESAHLHLRRYENGTYRSDNVEAQWEGWLSRANYATRAQGDAEVTALRECADVLREMRIAFPDPDRQVYRSASDVLAKLDAALAAQPKGESSVESDYVHFLAYSRLSHDPLLKYAYFHGADVGIPYPSEQTRGDGVDDDELLQDASDVYMAYVGQDDALPSTDGLAAALKYIRRHAAPRQAVPDGLAKDAARYRWLNERIEVTINRGCPSTLYLMLRTEVNRDQPHSLLIDQAIDDAMIAAAPSAGRMGVDRG